MSSRDFVFYSVAVVAHSLAITGLAQGQEASGAIQLNEIVVEGQTSTSMPLFAGGQVAEGARIGLLGEANLFKTPFSVTGYAAPVIRDRQARTVAEALAVDPSVRMTSPAGGLVDSFYVRGLPIDEGTQGETAFDGVYGVAPNFRVFGTYVDRIEVFKGLSAMLSGMSPNGGVGGVINIVPKRADRDLTRVGVSYVSDGQVTGYFDVARRAGAQRQWGLRVNGEAGGGHLPFDTASERMRVGAVSADYRGDRFRTWLDVFGEYEHLTAPVRPFLLASGLAVPPPPDGRRNVQQPWEWSALDEKGGLWKAEFDLTDKVTLFGDIGGARGQVNRFFGLPKIIDAAGDTVSTPQYYDLGILRSSMDAGARAKFTTGFVAHAASVQVSRYADVQYRALPAGVSYTSNIYLPQTQPAQTFEAPGWRTRLADSVLSGVAVADTSSVLEDRVSLSVGLRQQNVRANNYAPVTAVPTTAYNKGAVSPMAGLVVRPIERLSLYANVIEGLSRGDVAPASATNAGEIFAPYKSRQYETGAKLDLGKVGTTLGAFQITKPAGELASDGSFSVTGEQRIRGLEWSLFGALTPYARVLGGATLLDGRLTRTQTASNLFNRPIGVPTLQMNMSGELDVPGFHGLTFTGGAIYTGRQFIDTANTQSLSPWVRFDLGARYSFEGIGRTSTVRFNVENVADLNYWASVASFGTFSQGAPRTFRLSYEVDL